MFTGPGLRSWYIWRATSSLPRTYVCVGHPSLLVSRRSSQRATREWRARVGRKIHFFIIYTLGLLRVVFKIIIKPTIIFYLNLQHNSHYHMNFFNRHTLSWASFPRNRP